VEGETIHNMPFPVRVPELVDALRAIEGFSRGVRAGAGLPEPVVHRAH
jgi:glycerol dehydrogenase